MMERQKRQKRQWTGKDDCLWFYCVSLSVPTTFYYMKSTGSLGINIDGEKIDLGHFYGNEVDNIVDGIIDVIRLFSSKANPKEIFSGA